MTTALSPGEIRAAIDRILPDLIATRRDLHAHPELGYAETRTCGVVQRELTQAGIEHKTGLAGGTGVLGFIDGGDGDALGLRADMDALPIDETSGVEHASTCPGVMHACGHDGHTTILIGAARVLAELSRSHPLPRPVSFLFQPAEEGGSGGLRMVEDGCLKGDVIGPPIGQMYGLHGWPQLPAGVVGTRPGPLLAAADKFEIRVFGTSAHAAFPHLGHDPIVAASALVTAAQTIRSRETDPLDGLVVSITEFHGGNTHNVIPGEVHLRGTVRTMRNETQSLAQRRLEEIARQIAAAHGCAAELDYTRLYPITRNDPGRVDRFNDVARSALGPQRVIDIPHPFMGAEDFAFYCREVPSCFFVLGLQAPEREPMPNLHQSDFDFNDDVIATGVELFCRLALDVD